jgi:hypothetical protein
VFYDSDGNGDAAAQQFAYVGAAVVTSNDFVVI